MGGNETFGRLLRERRQRSVLTLEGLAERSGVSVRAISDMERGHSLPRQATLNELMDALELDEEQRRRLVQASMQRAWQVPKQLPPDLAVFCGREKALSAVDGFGSQIAWRGGRVVISAIGGMAGVGKTTLAVHWAHQVADRFPDGQLYVNLRGFEDSGRPLDPREVLGGFLSALGVPSAEIPRSSQERSALFMQHTASRRLIVVLDNARDTEQVKPLLPASTESLTIITSRNQLSGLDVAGVASLVNLDVWTRAEALAALAARIGDDRCRTEPDAAVELVELCGFLPLAVAITGAQLRATPQVPLRIAARELREARLDTLSAGDQRADVRAVFSWSYQALAPQTARLFRYLTVHPGPAISAEAAASLAGIEITMVRRHLRELASASLLTRDAAGRHVLHDLVRAYGRELFEAEQDDRLGAETRLLDYLRHNADTASHVLSPRPGLGAPSASPGPGVVRVPISSRTEALDWFRQEEAALAAALDALEDQERALAAARATHEAGSPETALLLLSIAESQPVDEYRRREVDLLRAQLAFTMDRGADAPLLLLNAARQMEKYDVEIARETYLEAINAAMFTGSVVDGGAAQLEAALASRSAPPGRRPPRPADLLLDGTAARLIDGHAAGVPTLKRALRAFRDPDLDEADGLRWLWLAGVTAVSLWDHESWSHLSSRHLQLARQPGGSTGLPLALTMSIAAHVFAGELSAAASLDEEVRTASEAVGTPPPLYGALLLSAWQGRGDECADLADAFVRETDSRGEGNGQVVSAWAKALLFNGLGRYSDALAAAHAAGANLRVRDPGVATWSLAEYVEAAARAGTPRQAADALRQLSELTQPSDTDWALGVEARSRALITESKGAEAHYREAIDRLSRTNVRGELARAHLLYGEWLRQEHRRQAARDQLQTAHDMFIAMGMKAFAERAAGELLTIGEHVPRRAIGSSDEVTSR